MTTPPAAPPRSDGLGAMRGGKGNEDHPTGSSCQVSLRLLDSGRWRRRREGPCRQLFKSRIADET